METPGETRLTLGEARARIEEIRQNAGDYEKAHACEDSLRADVLRHIAAGCDAAEAAELARIALSTDEIEFERFCA